MGIPIIDEISQEITRLYIAGSPLAKGDPRISKYIPTLEKLGQKAPVFKAIAAKLSALTSGEENGSPEQLMEVGMLIYSVMYTQGKTEPEGEIAPLEFGDSPLELEKVPYSTLHQLLEILETKSQKHSKELIQAYQSGQYRDPRLYQAYCQAITDRHSFVSDFIEEQILPSIGEEMVPFIEDEMKLDGGKRDARLFKALYKIKGRDILDLSLRVLEEGSEPMIVEALYTLREDHQYEDILLRYARDKKAEIKQAAYTALVSMQSQKAEELILEALEGRTVGSLKEALIASSSSSIAAKVLEVIKKEMPDFAKKTSKLTCLLEVLAYREETSGLDYLKSLYTDHELFDKILRPLELTSLAWILYEQNTPEKNQLLFEIACQNKILKNFKCYASVRLYSPEKVYEVCCDDFKEQPSLGAIFNEIYGFGNTIVDSEKNWDRRWAMLFLEYDRIPLAGDSLYDDDIEGWTALLDRMVKGLATNKTRPYHPKYLLKAKQIGIPNCDKYYQAFIDAGYLKEFLEGDM